MERDVAPVDIACVQGDSEWASWERQSPDWAPCAPSKFSGCFVRQNVLVGPRPNGGYDCESDIVAFHPKIKHVLHIEPSMDSHTWDKREKRFRKKFEAGRKHIRKIFDGFETRPQIEQVALLVYASKDSHQSLGGAPIMLMPELLAQIINRVRQHELNVPEHFTILRTIQFIAKYPEQLHAPLFGPARRRIVIGPLYYKDDLYYTITMKAVVQARLDAASRRDLTQLVQTFGWSPSQVVREALRRLAASHPPPRRPRVAGLGKFSSGVPDLGSNKKHLRGFGR